MKIKIKEALNFKFPEKKTLTGEELISYITNTGKTITAPSVIQGKHFDPVSSKKYGEDNLRDLISAIKNNPDTIYTIYGEGENYILVSTKDKNTQSTGDQISNQTGLD